MRRLAAVPLFVILLVAAMALRPAAVQPAYVVVRVLEVGTGRPVVNADVLERGSGARRLTDERGEARLAVPADRAPQLRVRQLGFQPADRVVANWPASRGEVVVVTLSRLVVLSTTTSEASNACRGTPDSIPSPLSFLALEQLRFGAEQYERFWDAYPFHLSFERRTAYFSADGVPLTVIKGESQTLRRNWSDPYRPGRVVFGQGSSTSAVPLSINALADPVFWDNHCLVARGIITRDDRRMLPLEFLPALHLRTPDWAGIAWLDSATSELRRVDFQLMGLEPSSGIKRMEGYITFTYPSPYIARPDSLVSLWWMREAAEGRPWGSPSFVELLHVAKVQYMDRTPPGHVP